MEKGADRKQIQAFHKAARELGADENEDQFKETLRTLAKAKPVPLAHKKKN